MKQQYTGKLRCITCGDTESLSLMTINPLNV